MPSCIVKGCTTSHLTKPPAPSLHAFPQDFERIKLWIAKTGQFTENFVALTSKIFQAPRAHYRMCGRHFTKDCYEVRGSSIFLRKDAVPSIFDTAPPTLFPTAQPKKRARKRKLSAKLGTQTTEAERLVSLQDHDYFYNPNTCLSATASPGGSHPAVAMTCTSSDTNPFLCPQPVLKSRKKVSHVNKCKTIGTTTEYFPGQVHKATQVPPFFPYAEKNTMVCMRPKVSSIGLQCKLVHLPPLERLVCRRAVKEEYSETTTMCSGDIISDHNFDYGPMTDVKPPAVPIPDEEYVRFELGRSPIPRDPEDSVHPFDLVISDSESIFCPEKVTENATYTACDVGEQDYIALRS